MHYSVNIPSMFLPQNIVAEVSTVNVNSDAFSITKSKYKLCLFFTPLAGDAKIDIGRFTSKFAQTGILF